MNNKKKSFPVKLHSMLDNVEKQGQEHIVSWLPEGDSFRVHNVKYFEEYILPKYFKTKVYKSFQRNLSWYGFCFNKNGPEEGAYKHKLFVRNDPTLCEQMGRPSSKKAPKSGGRLQVQQLLLKKSTERPQHPLSPTASTTAGAQDDNHGSSLDSESMKRLSNTDAPSCCVLCLSPFSKQERDAIVPSRAPILCDACCEASVEANSVVDTFSWLFSTFKFSLEDVSYSLEPRKISY